jgi:hypothetical protein
MMSVLPQFDTLDGPIRIFREPEDLNHDYEDANLLPCGHFDGHDVYRHVARDRYVLVYADDAAAVYEASYPAVPSEAENWGTKRAIVKGRKALIERIDTLVERLYEILQHHPDDTPFDVMVCDAASDAAEMIESLRGGASL